MGPAAFVAMSAILVIGSAAATPAPGDLASAKNARGTALSDYVGIIGADETAPLAAEAAVGPTAGSGTGAGGGDAGIALSLPSPKPSDQHATPAAAALLSYLSALSRSGPLRVVFGHQLDTTSGQEWQDPPGAQNRSDTLASVGDLPGLFGFNGFAMVGKASAVTDSIAAARALPRNGIVTVHFPADNPVTGLPKDNTHSPMTALLPGGPGNSNWTAWLDVVAEFCDGVQPRPVLFRPFHENLGGWNWWGSSATTPAEYRAGWNYSVSYLRVIKNTHNVLMVYAPDKPAMYFGSWQGLLDRYPGDGLVDITAFDHYDTGDGNFSSSLKDCCLMVAQLAASRGKVPAIAEFGYKHGSQNITASGADWFMSRFLSPIQGMQGPLRMAYAMTWTNSDRGYWVPLRNQTAHRGFYEFYKSNSTLFAAH
eukprot:gene2979-3548_t